MLSALPRRVILPLRFVSGPLTATRFELSIDVISYSYETGSAERDAAISTRSNRFAVAEFDDFGRWCD